MPCYLINFVSVRTIKGSSSAAVNVCGLNLPALHVQLALNVVDDVGNRVSTLVVYLGSGLFLGRLHRLAFFALAHARGG